MVISVPWRAAQVVVIGVSPLALSVWQTATLVEILFHHFNIELPVEVERWLSHLIVTPRMHGIHTLHRPGRNRLELVEWADAVVLAARHAAAERPSTSHHHRRARLSSTRGRPCRRRL
jgi:hypothetical protein